MLSRTQDTDDCEHTSHTHTHARTHTRTHAAHTHTHYWSLLFQQSCVRLCVLCGPSAACRAGLADFCAGDKKDAIFRAGELVCVCVCVCGVRVCCVVPFCILECLSTVQKLQYIRRLPFVDLHHRTPLYKRIINRERSCIFEPLGIAIVGRLMRAEWRG